MKTINTSVKKLLKNQGKIVTIEQLKKMFQESEVTSSFYKKIFYLKKRWYLISLKKDLFYVKDPSYEIDREEIIDKFYWDILYDYVRKNYVNKYFIWWVKALEIRNNNFSIPDKIILVNSYKRDMETLLKWKKVFNTVYSIKWFDLNKSFKYFQKQTKKVDINWKKFIVANYELSLLESLYSLSILEEKYVFELGKKNIRKNYKRINLEVLEYFLKAWKYWSACKRFYEISLYVMPEFAEKLKYLLLKWYWL